jgi:hypothetical protein
MIDERVYEADGALVVPWRVSYVIELQTPEQIAALPDGTVLRSISGETVVKGSDPIDLDTRAGRTAWGLPDRREPIFRRWNSPGYATIARLRAALQEILDLRTATWVTKEIARAALAAAKEADQLGYVPASGDDSEEWR